MALGRVLVVGVDPARLSGWDPQPVQAAIARGHARFGDHGIEADLCLVAPDENARSTSSTETPSTAVRCGTGAG